MDNPGSLGFTIFGLIVLFGVLPGLLVGGIMAMMKD